MAIINREERAPGPEIYLLELWFYDVQNDRNTIFIVVPDHTLVCIRCISYYDSIFLWRKLSWVIVLSELNNLLFFHLHVLFSLADSHFHSTILDDVVWAHVFLFLFPLGFFSCLLLLSRHSLFGWLRSCVLLLIQTFLERIERVLNYLWLILALWCNFVWESTFTIFLVFMWSKQLGAEGVGGLGQWAFRRLVTSIFTIVIVRDGALRTLLYLVRLSLNFLKWTALEASDFV